MAKSMSRAAFPNRFRQDLLASKRLIGCWCSLGTPITTEVLRVTGFDWLLLDGEHAPNDVLSFISQLMALKDSGSAPVARPPSNDVVVMKRLLDARFHNFLIPFAESAEEARRAVATTCYPPAGVRGISVSQPSNRYGTVPNYNALINDNIAVMMQIESRAGAEAAAATAAVDGVDVLFMGPSDLAAAFGHIGNPDHAEVQKAISTVLAVARAVGKPSGTLAPVEADARRYLQMGATFVAVGCDLGVLRMGTEALANRSRDPVGTTIAAPC
jgi:2-dehydro-3-deoxyglucarate aldolase